MWNSVKVFSKQLFLGVFVLAVTWVASVGLTLMVIEAAGLVVRLVGGTTSLPRELVYRAAKQVVTVVLCFVASFLVGKLVTEMEE